MNQEQVTAENTEEKAAEVTASSEMAGQTQEAVRPKGKWFGRGIYGSKDVPIRILDGLIGVLIVVIVGMIISSRYAVDLTLCTIRMAEAKCPHRRSATVSSLRSRRHLTSPDTPLTDGIRKRKARRCYGISSRKKLPAI